MRVFFYIGLIAALFSHCLVESASDDVSGSSFKEYSGIIAVVNGSVITVQDVEDRICLVLFSIGSSPTPELMAQIRREVIREMVNELLQWQCAEKYAPKVGWTTDEAVKSSFDNIARRNNLAPNAFCKLLESKRVNKDILLRQIRTNLSWMAYLNARFGKFINISESEINRTMNEIKERQNKESYYICRMFFPVSDPKNDGAVLAQVNNIMRMLANGADFHNLARQFSKSADANKGGVIGWVFHGQLSSEENLALDRLPIGGRTIVRNSRGYVILYLQDKRDAGLRSFTTLRFVQVALPFQEPNPTKEMMGQLKSYMIDLKSKSANCHQFIKNAKNSGVCAVSEPIVITLEEVQPQFRTMLTSLQAGGIGHPMVAPNCLIVICMLDRNTQTIPEPTREDICNRKINERLSVFADREMHDLMKRADIKWCTEIAPNHVQ